MALLNFPLISGPDSYLIRLRWGVSVTGNSESS